MADPPTTRPEPDDEEPGRWDGDRGYRAARLAALIGGLSFFVLMNTENRLGIVIAVAVFATLMIRPELDDEKWIFARLLGGDSGRRAGGRGCRFALYAALLGGLLLLLFVLTNTGIVDGQIWLPIVFLMFYLMFAMIIFGLPLLLIGLLIWAACLLLDGMPPRRSPPGATSNADSPPRER